MIPFLVKVNHKELVTLPDTYAQITCSSVDQANHLGVTIQADIIKQKQPENNGLFNAAKFAKTHKDVYEKLTPGEHRILPGSPAGPRAKKSPASQRTSKAEPDGRRSGGKYKGRRLGRLNPACNR
ncbi:MAG: hypothetical protein KAS72_11065 [Phycisphaerales bacterium]|nr:hypothetical protein [Phycisphaerales bacterium]